MLAKILGGQLKNELISIKINAILNVFFLCEYNFQYNFTLMLFNIPKKKYLKCWLYDCTLVQFCKIYVTFFILIENTFFKKK